MSTPSLPSFDELMNPTLEALRQLGGSGTIAEIDARAAEIAQLSDEQLEIPHNPDKGGQTEVEYRFAWTRTYLKKAGYLENSQRGVWALTPKGREAGTLEPKNVKRNVRQQQKNHPQPSFASADSYIDADTPDDASDVTSWRDALLDVLLNLHPSAFERLVQRLLRESGFIQVEVTGKTGDGGIDGKGIMRLGGMLSFHVIFQCKRYRGSVSANQVRDFRGAMVGRADKGLLITTGNFTKDAIREATRDGAPAIDLIDGDLLIDRLRELELGITTKQVTHIFVDETWFANI